MPGRFKPRRRIDQALYAVVMEAYVHGISTRSVDDLVVCCPSSILQMMPSSLLPMKPV